MKGIVECEEYMIPHSLHLSDGIVHCLLSLFRITVNSTHSHCLPHVVTPPTQVLEAQEAKLSFFNVQRLQDITEQLITHYMVLSEDVSLIPLIHAECGSYFMGMVSCN